jgi:hypothetical protein
MRNFILWLLYKKTVLIEMLLVPVRLIYGFVLPSQAVVAEFGFNVTTFFAELCFTLYALVDLWDFHSTDLAYWHVESVSRGTTRGYKHIGDGAGDH